MYISKKEYEALVKAKESLDKIRSAGRRWAKNNREKIRESHRKWYHTKVKSENNNV